VQERWRSHATEEEVFFYSRSTDVSNEHLARRGVLVTRPYARATVLVMHGYTSNKVDMGILRLLFSPYNVLLFDFRAHGEDVEGQVSTFGCDEVYDVIAAVDYIRSHAEIKHLPIIGYGFSMGASTAIEANLRSPKMFDALILDCPFDSTDDIIKRGFDKIFTTIRIPFLEFEYEVPGRSLFERYAMNPYMQPVVIFLLSLFTGMDVSKVSTMPKHVRPVESAKNIRVPTQLITCYADSRVPLDAIVRIYKNIPSYKRLWITKGTRHFGSLFHNPELYQHMVTNFIEKVLGEMVAHEVHERVMGDVDEHEIVRMHNRLYNYPLPQDVRDFLKTSI
jgi:pimeloyl-ACP methyl ester carboxylesterase